MKIPKGGVSLEKRVQNRTGSHYGFRDQSGEHCDLMDCPENGRLVRNQNMESDEQGWREGVLPPMAPLANPYVPFQRDNPPTYEPRNAVVRGTLFPGLDLPYRGMINKEPLSRTGIHDLQTLAFAITELGEYLDTHSHDQKAFELFRTYVRMYNEARDRYEANHGPLTANGTVEQDTYSWLKDPWPWDYDANKEG